MLLASERDEVVGLGVEPLQPGQVVGDDGLARIPVVEEVALRPSRNPGTSAAFVVGLRWLRRVAQPAAGASVCADTPQPGRQTLRPRRLGRSEPTEVPRRPGVGRRRQHRRVRVQQRCVPRVGHRGEHVALDGGGFGEHRERLVRVGGDDDGVVQPHLAVAVGDLDSVSGLEDRGDLHAGADLLDPRGHRRDVPLRAAGHRAPLRAAEDAEHPVVLQEREQVARRVVERDLRVARPHGGDEGLHEVASEVRREPALIQERSERDVVAGRACRDLRSQHPCRPAVEPGDLGEHPEVARVGEVGRGGEDALATQGAGPLQAGAVVADRHRHLRGLGDHAELGEQPEQHRVGARVVHDEAGVDGQLAALSFAGLPHDMGVRVTAEAVVRLEQGHVRGA